MSINFFDAVLSGKAAARPTRDASVPWQPNDSFAVMWREFSEKGTLVPVEAPAHAPYLAANRQSDGTVKLSWRLLPELSGGLRSISIHRDGKVWKELSIKANDLIATGRDSTPEALRPMQITDDSREAHTYTLTFFDAANHESPASQPVHVP